MDRFDTGITPKELLEKGRIPFGSPWGELVLLATEEGYACLQAFCPHMEGPLWEGTLGNRELTCPWHQWRFSLETGSCTAPEGAQCPPALLLEVSLGPRETLLVAPRPE